MTDLETRLRNHLAHEAEQIDVPEGSPPVPVRRSPWSSVVMVPIAATFTLVALVGALVLFERSEPLTRPADNVAAITEPTTLANSEDTAGAESQSDQAEAQIELVEEIPGQGRVFAPNHPVMISAVPDLGRPGCEGFPTQTWQVVDLTDGSTTPVDDGRVTGTAITFGEVVAIADRCEGFLDSIRVGRFTDDESFTMDATTVAVDGELQQATLTADRASGELVAVTAESIRRLNLATGEWARSVASPFNVQPSSVSVIGDILVGAVYQDQLEVEIFGEDGELLYSLVNCSMVESDITDEEAVASGECGIYKVGGNGEPRLFWEEPVLTAKPIPNSDSVLAFTLTDDGAAGSWEIITPQSERHTVPGSEQSPDVVVSDGGNLLAVPSADAESTRIVNTEGVMA